MTITVTAVGQTDGEVLFVDTETGVWKSPVATIPVATAIAPGLMAAAEHTKLAGVEAGAVAAGALGDAFSTSHLSAFAHSDIATALQPADVGTAAYENATAFEVAGAVSTHESTFAHADIATALQPGDVGTAAYADTGDFEVAAAVSTHESTYDHSLIATAVQPTVDVGTLGSGTATDGQILGADGTAGTEWINNSGGFTEAGSAPTTPPYGHRWQDTGTGICYTYIYNGGAPTWVEL